ncbi:uncharacterized protein J3R85_008816 [Psidium guajava]|nr:uncharacterized protein J3R85_008816 [Psidium guajava]
MNHQQCIDLFGSAPFDEKSNGKHRGEQRRLVRSGGRAVGGSAGRGVDHSGSAGSSENLGRGVSIASGLDGASSRISLRSRRAVQEESLFPCPAFCCCLLSAIGLVQWDRPVLSEYKVQLSQSYPT